MCSLASRQAGRSGALPLDDFELQVDDAAAEMVSAIQDAAEKHLRRALADVVAGQPESRNCRGDVAEQFNIVEARNGYPPRDCPATALAFKKRSHRQHIAST